MGFYFDVEVWYCCVGWFGGGVENDGLFEIVKLGVVEFFFNCEIFCYLWFSVGFVLFGYVRCVCFDRNRRVIV